MKFSQAVDHFLKYLHAEKGYSPLTIREYRFDLYLFMRYLQENKNLSANEVTIYSYNKFDVASFLADLILEKNNSPITRNRKLFSLRSFSRYLYQQELLENDPTHDVSTSKTMTRIEPVYLRLPQARKFIETIAKSDGKTVQRDLAIIKVFLYCGIRLSELINLDIDSLDLQEKFVKVLGKGNKERHLPLHPEICETLFVYLNWRLEIAIKNTDREALFVSLRGSRINPRTVQVMVKKYARKANFSGWDKITPHKLRHTFATLLYRETRDIMVLQQLLGHTNISTTQVYTHTDAEQRREALERFPEL